MEWDNGVRNLLGDRRLHRWRKNNLLELLEDYEEVNMQTNEIKTFRFKSQWGTEYNVFFFKSNYMDNNRIYVGCMCENEEYGGYEPYCDVTVNLDQKMPKGNYGFLDTNNGDRNLFNLMYGNGWIKDTGMFGFSGFCMYPLVEFTEKFLNEICESEV
jgi:hypothetical protein